MTLRPRRLILNLMLTDLGRSLTVRDAIRAGELFGIKESSVRVAMTRLAADGLIEASDRGIYVLGPAARDLAEDVGRWRQGPARLQRWRGGWMAVHCSALGRTDRKALRRRERALAMTGFREFSQGLFLRPDNLHGGVAAMRDRLRALGVPDQAPVFGVHELGQQDAQLAQGLWSSAALNRQYRKTGERLSAWMAKAERLEPEVAAREAYVIGDEAIREMVFDPLLPDEMIDAAAREKFFKAVLAYDEAGQAIWRRLYDHASAMTGEGASAPLH